MSWWIMVGPCVPVFGVLQLTTPSLEPVQLQACEAGLSQKLMEILGGPRLEACRLYVNLVCKILALLITQGLSFFTR